MNVLTKEQIAQLPDMVKAMECDHDRDIVYAIEAWVDLAPYLAATVIEQQAEIERLRGIVQELLDMLDYDKNSERYRIAVDAAYEEFGQ